ncbi:putative anti-sigma regulatory factor, serine/threonine protein kinase [Catenulispora acidiphila DSM 44928]|uniref:Putative anti-sigma regulatory factor, serine/threonine protein kinase n=1 Tax=Catenulispora acidiphila (strain DSM 44928 / JCM 14897 / NBRC 102108 / NRRL B-24433 / ID139908) TaxID=479433 RepID=C7Q133_CATAD|nr:anti-sigma regulatory factor [Catenulispora acidiphila]ACU71708.1 putative anti-sigma regulatory factor, serine/threonine protein kinase [Catenulispora acidiphila DSM 44928]
MGPGTAAGPIRTQPIAASDDVVRARQLARTLAVECGLSLVEQTKLVTAASELARNTLVYGGGGRMDGEMLKRPGGRGVRLTFADEGPGIPDTDLALRDGWSSGTGMGLGLSGARRLVDEFDLNTGAGQGTIVTVIKWTR